MVYDSTVNFRGTATFFNNSAIIGGCISTRGEGSVHVTGFATFSFNNAGRGAAMALLEGTSGNFFGERVTMTENKVSSSGGALYVEATSGSLGLAFGKMGFFSNYAAADGGAITMLSVGASQNQAQVLNCTFDNNEAGDAGGGVFFAGGFANIFGSTFSQNVAGKHRHTWCATILWIYGNTLQVLKNVIDASFTRTACGVGYVNQQG